MRLLRVGWYDQWQWDGTAIILSCRRLRGRTFLHTSCTFSRPISWEGSVVIYLADAQVLSCKNLKTDISFFPENVASRLRRRHVATFLQHILARHLSSLVAKMLCRASRRHFSVSLVCFYARKPVVLSLQRSCVTHVL